MRILFRLEIVAGGEKAKRIIITRAKTTLSPHSRLLVPCIRTKGKRLDLPKRDVFFEPSEKAIIMFTHSVNAQTDVIMVENDTGAPVVLPKHIRLGSIVDTEVNGSSPHQKATMQNSRSLRKKNPGNTSY